MFQASLLAALVVPLLLAHACNPAVRSRCHCALRVGTRANTSIGTCALALAVSGGAGGRRLRRRLPIKTYTTADGLAHNYVKRIVKDSRGFLWFCTVDGLSRFDGYTFTNFGVEEGLPHPSVNDLLETRKGEYRIATNGGLVRFDPKAGLAAA